MADLRNGGPPEWRTPGMAEPRNGGPKSLKVGTLQSDRQTDRQRDVTECITTVAPRGGKGEGAGPPLPPLGAANESLQYLVVVDSLTLICALGAPRPLPRRLQSRSGICIRSLDPYSGCGWLPRFNWDFLVQRYVYDRILTKFGLIFPETCAKLWKNAPSRSVAEFYIIFHGSGYGCGDFENLINSSISTFCRTCMLLTDRQTDRQTERQTKMPGKA